MSESLTTEGAAMFDPYCEEIQSSIEELMRDTDLESQKQAHRLINTLCQTRYPLHYVPMNRRLETPETSTKFGEILRNSFQKDTTLGSLMELAMNVPSNQPTEKLRTFLGRRLGHHLSLRIADESEGLPLRNVLSGTEVTWASLKVLLTAVGDSVHRTVKDCGKLEMARGRLDVMGRKDPVLEQLCTASTATVGPGEAFSDLAKVDSMAMLWDLFESLAKAFGDPPSESYHDLSAKAEGFLCYLESLEECTPSEPSQGPLLSDMRTIVGEWFFGHGKNSLERSKLDSAGGIFLCQKYINSMGLEVSSDYAADVREEFMMGCRKLNHDQQKLPPGTVH